jgi:hypothetical protein
VEATLKAFCPYAGGEEVSWTGGLVVATWHAWACQRTVRTRRGARQLEARRSRTRCREGRMKQKRCTRHCRLVLGTGNAAVQR